MSAWSLEPVDIKTRWVSFLYKLCQAFSAAHTKLFLPSDLPSIKRKAARLGWDQVTGSAIRNIQFLYLKKRLGSFHSMFRAIIRLRITFAAFDRTWAENSAQFTSDFMPISDIISSIHDFFFINVNTQIEDFLHKNCINLAKRCKRGFSTPRKEFCDHPIDCLLWSSRHFGVAATLTNLFLFFCRVCSLTSTNVALDCSLRAPMNCYQMRTFRINSKSFLFNFSWINEEAGHS